MAFITYHFYPSQSEHSGCVRLQFLTATLLFLASHPLWVQPPPFSKCLSAVHSFYQLAVHSSFTSWAVCRLPFYSLPVLGKSSATLLSLCTGRFISSFRKFYNFDLPADSIRKSISVDNLLSIILLTCHSFRPCIRGVSHFRFVSYIRIFLT